MLIDKIWESKLTKNERDLGFCVIAAAMLLTVVIVLSMIGLVRSLDQIHSERFLNILQIYGVIGMLIFVFRYHRIKLRMRNQP